MEIMELKAKPTRTVPEAKAKTRRLRLLGFIQEFKDELKRVSWTTKSELMFCTKIVVITTFLLGMAIYFTDLLIKGALDSIALLVNAVFG
jgi:preprotein translocase subunit SecE